MPTATAEQADPTSNNSPVLLNQHPLRKRRKPGPPGQETASSVDEDLLDACEVLDLIAQGVLPESGPPPLPLAVDARGKPLKRLTAEDEQMLAYRIQTWGDIDARNALVLANMGLVHLVANQLKKAHVRYEDLVQEGTLGLLRATETFEPNRQIRFSTYCVWWIRAKIQRLLQRLDKDDTPSISGANMETHAHGRRRRPRARAVSLESPLDRNEEQTLMDLVANEDEAPEAATLRFERDRTVSSVLTDIVAELGDPRLRVIVRERLLADEPQTLSEIGKTLNLSREGARLLENKVMRLARERLAHLS